MVNDGDQERSGRLHSAMGLATAWQAEVLVCLTPPILTLDVPVPGIYGPSADESPFEGESGK